MIIIDSPQLLYGQEIMLDMISPPYFKEDVRSVPEDFRAVYNGLYSKRNMKNTSGVETTLPLDMLIKNFPSFDADRFMPMQDEYHVGESDDEFSEEKSPDLMFDPATCDYYTFDYYRRTLDGDFSVDVSYITGYIEFCIRHRGNALNTKYTYAHKAQTNKAVNNEGDDNILLDADLVQMFDTNVISPTEQKKLLGDLAYHLKRLFYFYTRYSVNMLSFFQAIIKANITQQREKVTATAKGTYSNYSITSNKLIDEGVYMCNVDGKPISLFTKEQKSTKLFFIFKVYIGVYPEYISYRHSMLYTLELISKLHLDFIHLDLEKFDKTFWDNLIIENFIWDEHYLPHIHFVNKKIVNEVSYKEALRSTLDNIRITYESHPALINETNSFFNRLNVKSNRQKFKNTLEFYNSQLTTPYNIDDLEFRNSIAYINDTLFTFNLEGLYPNQSYGPAKGIITENGLIFPITRVGLVYNKVSFVHTMFYNYIIGNKLTQAEEDSWIKLL